MQSKMKLKITSVLLVLFSGVAGAQAQDEFLLQPRTLKEAAQLAVLKNPEVMSRWHAFNEAYEEIGVARGGFFPKLDVSVGRGRIRTKQRAKNPALEIDNTYFGTESTVTLQQMIFDGFATYKEVKRLGRAKLVRYFELLDASESVALEAARAYHDVVRHREQVGLAEDNYVQHYAAHEQLKRRAASGVGKRVDVDQAASRLALADVNVTTAYANLHDVTARYQRIVGANPPKEMSLPKRTHKNFPEKEETALSIALQRNPALRASIENIEAAQYDLEVRRAAFMPRVDFFARRDHYSNYEDIGHRDETQAQIRLSYNLFNGMSDVSRFNQYRERKNIALDMREKACRDMRQTLAISYNDTLRLNDQLNYLATQVDLVAKTRTAYRDQFNIGQRTLLDLLNTQNEYFDARRAQVNADIDLSLAYLRSYAGMGQLLEALELKRIELESEPEDDDFTPVDLELLCPPVAPTDATLNREALLKEARKMSEGTGFIGTRSQPPLPAP
jgi:adhesin transport system outer membrane protein